MIIASFLQMLPILSLTLIGYLLGRSYTIKAEDLVKVVSDVFLPALVFGSLAQSDLSGTEVVDMAKASSLVCLLLLAVSLLWAKLSKADTSAVVPPIVFMNSGFLGIPLMNLWGGSEAMNHMLIFDQMQGIWMFSIGILIVTGSFTKQGLLSTFKSPVLITVLVAFLFLILKLQLPGPLTTCFTFAGQAASPLAALALGLSIRKMRVEWNFHLVGSLLIRIVGGYLIGWLVASMLGLSSVARTVVMVATALPTAMYTSIFPLRYGKSNEYPGAMVILSSMLGILTIPLTFALAG